MNDLYSEFNEELKNKKNKFNINVNIKNDYLNFTNNNFNKNNFSFLTNNKKFILMKMNLKKKKRI